MDEKEQKDFEFMNKDTIDTITKELIERLGEFIKSGKISGMSDEFLKNKLNPILKKYSTAPFTEYVRVAVIRKVKDAFGEGAEEIKTRMLYKEMGLDFDAIKEGGAKIAEIDNLPKREVPKEEAYGSSEFKVEKSKKKKPLNDSLELFKLPIR